MTAIIINLKQKPRILQDFFTRQKLQAAMADDSENYVGRGQAMENWEIGTRKNVKSRSQCLPARPGIAWARGWHLRRVLAESPSFF